MGEIPHSVRALTWIMLLELKSRHLILSAIVTVEHCNPAAQIGGEMQMVAQNILPAQSTSASYTPTGRNSLYSGLFFKSARCLSNNKIHNFSLFSKLRPQN